MAPGIDRQWAELLGPLGLGVSTVARRGAELGRTDKLVIGPRPNLMNGY